MKHSSIDIGYCAGSRGASAHLLRGEVEEAPVLLALSGARQKLQENRTHWF